jgi:hypothetical protein
MSVASRGVSLDSCLHRKCAAVRDSKRLASGLPRQFHNRAQLPFQFDLRDIGQCCLFDSDVTHDAKSWIARALMRGFLLSLRYFSSGPSGNGGMSP